jgi:DNA-binding beta-propeller fold protein YncE
VWRFAEFQSCLDCTRTKTPTPRWSAHQYPAQNRCLRHIAVAVLTLGIASCLSCGGSVRPAGASASHETIYVATRGHFDEINVASDRVVKSLSLPRDTWVGAIALSPNLRVAYLLSDNKVVVVQLTNFKLGSTIRIGPPTGNVALTQVGLPTSIALSPNGRTAYVPVPARGVLVPLDLPSRRADTPIMLGGQPRSVAVSPDGRTAYVANSGLHEVQAIDLQRGIITGSFPNIADPEDIVVAPNGKSAYVANASLVGGGVNSSVVPLNLVTLTESTPLGVGSPTNGYAPEFITISPNGSQIYVANTSSATNSEAVLSINSNTGRVLGSLGNFSHPISIAENQEGTQLYVANSLLSATSFPGPKSTVRSASITVIGLHNRRIEGRIGLRQPPSAVASH